MTPPESNWPESFIKPIIAKLEAENAKDNKELDKKMTESKKKHRHNYNRCQNAALYLKRIKRVDCGETPKCSNRIYCKCGAKKKP